MVKKGTKLSEETRRRISESLKGNTSRKGKIPSEETRRKMSESRKGEKNAFFGKTHSEETMKKLYKSGTLFKKGMTPWNKGKTGLKLSEETRKKMSEAKKGKIPWNKGNKHL